jgi:hypothetical protein
MNRRDLSVECSLPLPLIAMGRHDEGAVRDFFLFEIRV